MILLFSLAFISLSLGLWQNLRPIFENNTLFSYGFVDTVALAMVLGGIYWGAVANPDTIILEPLLAINLFCGSALFILFFFLLPTKWDVGSLTGWKLLIIPVLFFPGFFFWASAPPFLSSLCFPEEKGTGRGLFTIIALWFFSLAAGIFLSALWERQHPQSHRFLADISMFLSLALGFWLWLSRPPRDTEDLPLRFFPVKSLGYWTGD
jgi:hypothetical protein